MVAFISLCQVKTAAVIIIIVAAAVTGFILVVVQSLSLSLPVCIVERAPVSSLSTLQRQSRLMNIKKGFAARNIFP